MPYFIWNESPACDGWAVVKSNGDQIGCFKTKDEAIAQMIAVSIAEDIEPGGEYVRNANGPRIVICDIDGTLIWYGERDDAVYEYATNQDAQLVLVTGRLESDRANTVTELADLGIKYDRLIMNRDESVSTIDYKRDTAEKLLEQFNVVVAIENDAETLNAYRRLGIAAVNPASLSNRQTRAVDLTPPIYMQDAARQGLAYYEQGFGGDGLVERTIREARDMANGQVTADKWVRIAAWIARHMVDLDAPKNTDPNHPDYPGAGLVAHLLWGSGNTKEKATRAMEYAQSVVARLEAEKTRHKVELNKGKTMEQRHFSQNVTGLEIRADGDGRTFRGYAALFDKDSEPMGGFVERIAPGAFRRSLTSHGWDIKLLANHDAGRVLGSTRAKTLKLWEDSLGLWVEGILPNSPEGDNIAEAVRRGDIDAMSFGFSVQPGGEQWSADGKVRTLTDVKLFEVSIVAWPAYTSTIGTTSVRSLDQIATREDVSVEDLKIAIDAFVAGEDLTAAQGEMLKGVIDLLVIQDAAESMDDAEDMADGEDNPDAMDAVDSMVEMPTQVLLHQIQMKLKGF